MATINSFQDLECWKLARKVTNQIYICFWHIRDFGFRDQIQRASVSVMNNIAEWFWRTTAKEKIQFMNIAIWSAHEVHSMLFLASDLCYIEEKEMQELEQLIQQVIETSRWLRRYLKTLNI